MKKSSLVLFSLILAVAMGCSAPNLETAGAPQAQERALSGSNGSIDVSWSGTTITVSYAAGTTLSSCKLYISQGGGTGLVAANKTMAVSGTTYSSSVSDPSFVSGKSVYICVLKNQNGVETCVPQGSLANTTSWASYTIGSGSTGGGSGGTTTPGIPGYTLVWADEFDGSSLNGSNWVYETGAGGWGNNELEYYTSRSNNVSVAGGNLQITAIRENYNGAAWTSGRIKTQGKQSFTYGRLQARIKMPNGAGLWPAFWMLGANFSSVGWPKCGEIDIMEHVNSEARVFGTIHWDSNGYASWGQNTQSNYWNNFSVDVSQFHVYEVIWNSSLIKWYVDGVQYMEANIAGSTNGTDEFHRPFFFLLNLAVGGNWPGSPNSSTPASSTMYVDYVRAYRAN